jgi:Cytochrome c oxidase subunit VIa
VLPQPPAYDYLNRRVKPFPWGNNSLFYNAEVPLALLFYELTLYFLSQVNKNMEE